MVPVVTHAEGLRLTHQLSLPSIASAAVVQRDQRIVTLLRAYELALDKDRTYAAAQAVYRAMLEKVPQAKAALMPNVTLSAGLTATTSAPSSNSRLEETISQQNASQTVTQTTGTTTGTTTETSNTSSRQGADTASTTRTTSSSQTTSDTRRNEQSTQSTASGNRQDISRQLRGANAETAVDLTWPLFRPSLSRQLEQSQLLEEQALLQLKAARQDVALRVARAYFDVLLARENLDALNVQKTAIEQQLAVAENSFDEGVVTIADVREAQARKDAVLAQEVALRNSLKVKNTTLQALIGVRADAVQQLRVDDMLSRYVLPGELDHWSALAQEQAFGVQIETLALRIAQKELSKQTDAHKPTLDFVANIGANRAREFGRTRTLSSQTDQSSTNGSIGSNGTSNTTSTTGTNTNATNGVNTSNQTTNSSVSNQSTSQNSSQTNSQNSVDTNTSRPASRSRSYSKQWDAYIGVRLNIPLFDGGLTSSKVRESLALQEQKEIDLQRVRAEAALAAETAYLEAAGFLAEAQALKAAETSGRVALEANQMGYEVGLRINSDVLNAQQQLFTTRRDLMRAQVDALVATLRLKASVGGLGETEMQELDKWLK
jgi:outer membrane protein